MGSTISNTYLFNRHRALNCNHFIRASLASESLSSPHIAEYDSAHPGFESIDTCIQDPACQFKPNSLEADFLTQHSTASSTQWKTISGASLDSLLMSREGYKLVIHLQGHSAVCAADSIDNMLESGQLTDSQRRKYTAALRKLCGNRGILPTSHTITDDLNKVGELPIAGGGFAEVWEGNHRGRRVAIKVFRLYSSKDQAKVKKRFCKEAIIWKRLSHPNVLPFIGVATSPFKFCMVSPWMANGDVIVYMNSHPQANLIPQGYNRWNCISTLDERRPWRRQRSNVYFRHYPNPFSYHGIQANILIDDEGHACLADFGLTTIIPDTIPGYSMTTMTNEGTLRWMAPELLSPEQFGLTKCILSEESDIYAFGMVVYEVITRTVPFSQHRAPIIVMQKIITGVRPDAPSDAMTANLCAVWTLAEECWRQNRDQRPTAYKVLERLNMISGYWSQPESFPVVANVEVESDNHSDASSNSGYSIS